LILTKSEPRLINTHPLDGNSVVLRHFEKNKPL